MTDTAAKKSVLEQNLLPVLAAGISSVARRSVFLADDARGSAATELKLTDLVSLTALSSSGTDPLKFPADFFAPAWDRDYQHPSKHVHGLELSRGGKTYTRPFGWWRVAINVKGKFDDNDSWLGSPGTGPALRETRINSEVGEWAVSYVGLGRSPPDTQTQGILVSTPYLKLAKSNADEYNCDGRAYKMALQLRVDSSRTEPIQDGDYYVTKELSAVRPYGLLVLDMGPAEERNRRRGGKVSMAVMLQNILDKMREEAA